MDNNDKYGSKQKIDDQIIPYDFFLVICRLLVFPAVSVRAEVMAITSLMIIRSENLAEDKENGIKQLIDFTWKSGDLIIN